MRFFDDFKRSVIKGETHNYNKEVQIGRMSSISQFCIQNSSKGKDSSKSTKEDYSPYVDATFPEDGETQFYEIAIDENGEVYASNAGADGCISEDIYAIPLLTESSKFLGLQIRVQLIFLRSLVRKTSLVDDFKRWFSKCVVSRHGTLIEEVDEPCEIIREDIRGILTELEFGEEETLSRYHWLNQEFLTMYGIEGNPGPDDFKACMEDKLIEEIKTSSYKLEDMERIASDFMEFQQNLTDSGFSKFSRSHPNLTQRFNSLSKNLRLDLSHFLGIMSEAFYILRTGGTVHLIEGTSKDGIRLMEDIDLACSINGEFVIYDMCRGDRVYSERERPEKYAKLKNKFQRNEVKLVVKGHSVDMDSGNIKITKVKTDVFEAEFEKVEKSLSIIDSVTKIEAETILKECSSLIIPQKIKLKNFKPHKRAFEMMEQDLVYSVDNNNERSAKIYESLKSLCFNDEDYNFQVTDRLSDKDRMKPAVKIPRLNTSEFKDPFDVMAELISEGCDMKLLLDIYAAKTNPIECDEYKIRRLKDKEGNLVNAVEIITNEMSYRDLMESYECRDGRLEYLSYSECERVLDECVDVLTENVPVCDEYFKDIDDLVQSVGENSRVEEFARSIMSKTLSKICGTKLMDLMSTISRTYQSVLYGSKKFAYSKSGDVNGKKNYISIDVIDGKMEILVSNINSSQFDLRDKMCMIVGDIIDDRIPYIIKRANRWNTDWFNASPPDQEWYCTLLHKTLSFATMYYEKELVHQPKESKTGDQLLRSCVYPILLMTINDSKFSQVSESVRYAFVNVTGISVGTKELYRKNMWYIDKCEKFLETIFIHRNVKMTSIVELFAMNNKKGLLVKSYFSDGPDLPAAMRNGTSWRVAFPHELRSNPSEQSCFNAIYVCKMLTVTRYTKTMSESMVLKKELENNLEFRERYDMISHFDLRNFDCETKEDLFEYLKDMCVFKGDKYNINFSTLILSCLASHLKHMHSLTADDQMTIGQFIDDNYDLSEKILDSNLNMIANNKGMASINKGQVVGAVSVNKERIQTKSGKIITKDVMTSQNTKGYSGLLKYLSSYYKNEDIDGYISKEHLLSIDVKVEKDDSEIDCDVLIHGSTSLVGVSMNSYLEKLICVAKMVHKDQIGAREIAVTNPILRINAFMLEQISRYTRSRERSMRDDINLIEEIDKDEIVTSIWHKNLIKTEDDKVIYDSADCSQWGPSMLPYTMCFSLCSRYSGHQRRYCVELFKQFSRKLFKIPDNFYLKTASMENVGKTNSVYAAHALLRSINNEFSLPSANYNSQFLFSYQGMYQGILGNTSSIYHHDLLCLSEFVHKEKYDIVVTSFETSDDYLRVLYPPKTMGVYNCCELSLSLHTFLCESVGIKRNLYKSNFSEFLCEFNSLFRTKTGIYNPDVKSRLSYVTTSGIYDWYESSLRCMTLSNDYLANEGSYIGSAWVGVLNTHLELISSGRLSFYRNTDLAFRVPLEIGGMIRIDPLRNSTEPFLCILKPNYDQQGKLNMEEVSKLLTCSGNSCMFEEIEGSTDESLKLPSLSRSSMINMMSRFKKSKRKIYEFLKDVDESVLIPYLGNNFKRSMLYCLMSCLQREATEDSHSSAAVQFCCPQTPYESKIYFVNNFMYREMFGCKKVSRKDILEKALIFHRENFEFEGDTVKYNGVNFKNMRSIYDFDLCNLIVQQNNFTISMISPVDEFFKVISINKFMRVENYCLDTDPGNLMGESLLSEIMLSNLPKTLGGTSEISLLEFILMEKLTKSRIIKMTNVRRRFKLCLTSRDDERTIQEKILISNFIEGGKLEFKKDHTPGTIPRQNWEGLKYNMRKVIRICNGGGSPQLMDDAGSVTKNIMRLGSDMFSRVDITSILEELVHKVWSDSHNSMIQIMHDLFMCQMSASRRFDLYKARLKEGTFTKNTFSQSNVRGHGLKYECFKTKDNQIDHTLVCVQYGEVWRKYVTCVNTELTDQQLERSYKQNDKTFILRITEDIIDVKLKTINGNLFLCSSEHPIMYICDSPETRTNRVEFISRDMLFGTRDEILSLNVFEQAELERKITSYYFEPSRIFEAAVPETDEVPNIDLMEDMSDIDDSDWGSESEPDSVENDEVDLDDEHVTEVSSLKTTTTNNVRSEFTNARSLYLDKTKRERKWVLMMPSSFDSRIFDDSGGTSPLHKFLEKISSMQHDEAIWAKSCFIAACRASSDFNGACRYL